MVSQEDYSTICSKEDWREIVAWVGDLPPMPQVASRAIRVIENPDFDAKELCEIIETDSALATRVLKIANSVMFCRQREITTLKQALMMIGMKSLKGIILAAVLRHVGGNIGIIHKLVWEHSIATAMMALSLANYLGYNYSDEVFLLGLLHNLGQVVLISRSESEKKYQDVLQLIKENKLAYFSAEQKVFGFTTPLIGALVAKKWNFSSDTSQVILHYQDDISLFSSELQQDYKMMIIKLADMLAHKAGLGSPEGYPVQESDFNNLAEKLKIPINDTEQIFNDIITSAVERFQETQNIYE